ncbi:hypothetical protein BDZ85DRAFT_254516 [Elsinoe ampelina]|uniref:Uncharacterized protein n=1 Tax=Elsinoe ampelina TaxID=302913 RepID=A0A6A6GPM2_9PEZI|nr:hypothetical protein BDZ85DRAFT_254516 [Elsinoe ampelina]
MFWIIVNIVIYFFAFLRLEQWRDSVAQERRRPAARVPQSTTTLNHRRSVVLLAFAGYVALSNGIGAVVIRDACYGPDTSSGTACLDRTAWQMFKLVSAYTAADRYLTSKHGIAQTLMMLRKGRSEKAGFARVSNLSNVVGTAVTGERGGK